MLAAGSTQAAQAQAQAPLPGGEGPRYHHGLPVLGPALPCLCRPLLLPPPRTCDAPEQHARPQRLRKAAPRLAQPELDAGEDGLRGGAGRGGAGVRQGWEWDDELF